MPGTDWVVGVEIVGISDLKLCKIYLLLIYVNFFGLYFALVNNIPLMSNFNHWFGSNKVRDYHMFVAQGNL